MVGSIMAASGMVWSPTSVASMTRNYCSRFLTTVTFVRKLIDCKGAQAKPGKLSYTEYQQTEWDAGETMLRRHSILGESDEGPDKRRLEEVVRSR